LKSEMSSLDIAAITLELTSLIRGKYLDNVYQIGHKTFLFKFRPGDLNLLVEVGRRIHLTKYEVQIPKHPSQFSMALRKRIRGGRLADVRQHEFERTIILEIETAEGVWQVIAEFFRRANLVVVDRSGRISLALSYLKMRDRDIVVGDVFKHAPSSGLDPFKATQEDLSRVLEHGSVLTSKALVMMFSIGGPLAREILLRSGLEDVPVSKLSGENLLSVHHAMEDLHSKLVNNDLDPIVAHNENGDPVDVAPLSLKSLEHFPRRNYPSFNEAADEYFTHLSRRILLDKKKDALVTKEQELARVTSMQQKQLEDLSEAIKQNKFKGQLIINNLHYLQEAIREVLATKEKGLDPEKMCSEVQRTLTIRQIPIRLKSIDLNKGILIASIEGVDLSLSLTGKLQHLADRHFQVAKKAKEKLIGLRKAMEQSATRLKSTEIEREQADVLPDVKRRKERTWYEKFRWFYSSENFLVLAGKDATTNEVLIKKHTTSSDIVLHADAHGAPFVVVKTSTNNPSDSTILEAAQLAVSHSGMWAEKVAAADAYWVHRDQVSKEAPSGQYLTRGAFMVTGKRNYLKGVELRLAIGIQTDQGDLRIIGGPPSAIRAHAVSYVELLPGSVARSGLAKQILYELSKAPRVKSQAETLTIDQVMHFLPPGPCEIVLPK